MAKQPTRENIRRAAELASGVNSSQISMINEEPQQGKQFNWSSPSGASFVSTVPSATAAERVNTSRFRQQNNVAELSMGRNYTSEEQAAAASASAASIQPLVNREIQKRQLSSGSNRNRPGSPASGSPASGSPASGSPSSSVETGSVAKKALQTELNGLRNAIRAKYSLNQIQNISNNADILKLARISELQEMLSANAAGAPLSSVNATGAASAAGSPLILSAAPVSAAAVNGSAAAVNGSVPLGKQEAVVPVVTNAATKTATVKKYVSGQTFTPTADASQYKIRPITSSSSSSSVSATYNPNHRTVECIKITGTDPITMTETSYVATIKNPTMGGGKTSKSKKSKKRVTHKKK